MSRSSERSYSPVPFALGGIATIVIAFGAFGGWAATAPLASAVVASGVIAVETNRKTIQHLEGGLVSVIHVREADRVAAGDPLIELQTVEATANVEILKTRLAIARVVEARLTAERQGDVWRGNSTKNISIAMPTGSFDSIMDSQRELFAHRRNVLKNQTDILLRRIEQIQRQVDGLTRRKDALVAENVFMADEIGRLREGSGIGAVAANRLAAMEREGARLTGEIGTTDADIARASQMEAETRLEIVKLNNEYLERAVAELKEVQDQIAELEQQISVVDDIFARKIIRSPIDGAVQNLSVHAQGAVIGPGTPVMEIVPLDDRLIVNARIRPLDIEHLTAGLAAEIRLPALTRDHVGTWHGTIESLSADVVMGDRDEEPYYLARIVTDDPKDAGGTALKLLPGMPVDIIIPTAERTLLDYLADPLMDAVRTGMREK